MTYPIDPLTGLVLLAVLTLGTGLAAVRLTDRKRAKEIARIPEDWRARIIGDPLDQQEEPAREERRVHVPGKPSYVKIEVPAKLNPPSGGSNVQNPHPPARIRPAPVQHFHHVEHHHIVHDGSHGPVLTDTPAPASFSGSSWGSTPDTSPGVDGSGSWDSGSPSSDSSSSSDSGGSDGGGSSSSGD